MTPLLTNSPVLINSSLISFFSLQLEHAIIKYILLISFFQIFWLYFIINNND
jgi:hypothetical protein